MAIVPPGQAALAGTNGDKPTTASNGKSTDVRSRRNSLIIRKPMIMLHARASESPANAATPSRSPCVRDPVILIGATPTRTELWNSVPTLSKRISHEALAERAQGRTRPAPLCAGGATPPAGQTHAAPAGEQAEKEERPEEMVDHHDG